MVRNGNILFEGIAMDARIQDGSITFRANEVVIAALAARARRSGCSVSEYLRIIVREKVGLQ